MKTKNKIHQARKAKWLTLIKEQSESSLQSNSGVILMVILFTPSQNITVSFGDVRIEIGKNAPDDIIANIIKAVRHA